jgi:hypothetical protein
LPYHRVQVAGTSAAARRTSADLADVLARGRRRRPAVGVIERAERGACRSACWNLPGAPPVGADVARARPGRAAPGDALRFTHSADDAERAVRYRRARRRLRAAADDTPATCSPRSSDGERLPRKSTFFWPKPRTGLVFMPVR